MPTPVTFVANRRPWISRHKVSSAARAAAAAATHQLPPRSVHLRVSLDAPFCSGHLQAPSGGGVTETGFQSDPARSGRLTHNLPENAPQYAPRERTCLDYVTHVRSSARQNDCGG